MSLLGIHFNLVNIILATFIFGQGDDYTIFMTEGCQYEYAYRRPMLASYKQSIIISALIMFIGIGALIFAKHMLLPAPLCYIISLIAGFAFGYGLYEIFSRIPFFRWALLGIKKEKKHVQR